MYPKIADGVIFFTQTFEKNKDPKNIKINGDLLHKELYDWYET